MNFEKLLDLCGDLPVIDSNTLRAFGEPPERLNVQLVRWVRAGKLIRLRRELYILASRYRKHPVCVEYLANLMVRPSYISLERALAIHGLIPEAVPLVQSVTPGRPARYETPVGYFDFRHVKPDWFFGYREMPVGGQPALVATPEKALLDLVHLSKGEFTASRVEQLRLQNLGSIDTNGMMQMAARHGRPKLLRAATQFVEAAQAEREGVVKL